MYPMLTLNSPFSYSSLSNTGICYHAHFLILCKQKLFFLFSPHTQLSQRGIPIDHSQDCKSRGLIYHTVRQRPWPSPRPGQRRLSTAPLTHSEREEQDKRQTKARPRRNNKGHVPGTSLDVEGQDPRHTVTGSDSLNRASAPIPVLVHEVWKRGSPELGIGPEVYTITQWRQ